MIRLNLYAFVAVCTLAGLSISTARAQWFSADWAYGYHHHHHVGFPFCGGRAAVVWEPYLPLPVFGSVSVYESWYVAPAPITTLQQFQIPLAPVVPPAVAAAPPAAAVVPNGENFARKELMPADPMVDRPARIPVDNFNDPAEIRRRAGVLKKSTPAGRMRADRLISSGDEAFAEQILARATARYRDAIAKAPDYAEAHFRLAHAYVATRRYNLALKSALVALELAGTSRRDGFSLEDMYQGDQFPREQQMRRLIDASLREPTDGGLKFLIGFTLHYDGQRDEAQEYFRDALELEGMHREYVHHFLPIKPVAEPQEAAN